MYDEKNEESRCGPHRRGSCGDPRRTRLGGGFIENTITATGEDSNTATHSVTATYTPATVYHVDIEWGDLTFTYEPGVWTPEKSDGKDDLQYRKDTANNKTTIGWNNNDTHSIKVTNKSNANVVVALAYTADSDYSEVKGYFYDKNTEITEAWMQRADANVTGVSSDVGGTDKDHVSGFVQQGIASEATFELYLVGRPQKSVTGQRIGEVTVTLSAEDTGTTYSHKYEQKKGA